VDDATAIGEARTRSQPGQNRLKAHRLLAGLTQAEVAEALANLAWERDRERLAVDASQVSKWERGLKRPQRFYRRLFCALYGASEGDLGLRPPHSAPYPTGEDGDSSLLRGTSLPGVPPASIAGSRHPLEGEGFNGSLDALVAASTAEATALVSGAARAAYDQSTLIAQAYAAADDLASRYLTSPPAPILAKAHQYQRHVLTLLHDRISPEHSRDLYLVAALLSASTPTPALTSATPTPR